MAADLRAAEQRQVGVGEAEHALDRDVAAFDSRERRAHGGDLAVERIDEMGAVTPLDEQLLLAEHWPRDADLAVDRLRVDHEHATRRDGEVIDVAIATGHAPVVQDDHGSLGGSPLERASDRFLAARAERPCRLVLRRAIDCQQQTADERMALADTGLAIAAAPSILAPGAGAGPATGERLERRSGLRERVSVAGRSGAEAVQAGDGALYLVPVGARSGPDRAAAHSAAIRPLQLHRSRFHPPVASVPTSGILSWFD